MVKMSDVEVPKLTLEEVLSDGSTLTNPAADHRRLFLGEDGQLHLRDSSGTVTDIGGTPADILDIPTAEMDDTLVLAPDGAGGVEFRAESGGGGGGDILPLDVVPGSPHASDDEFTAGTLDAKWTDPATSTRTNLITLSNSWMILEPAVAGSANITTRGGYGIRQASPSGSFSVSCKLAYEHRANDVRAGVFTGRLTATAKGHLLGVQDSANAYVDAVGISSYSHSADWGAFDGFVSAATGGLGDKVVSWYKIVWDSASSTFSFYYSQNGVFWTLYTTRASMAQPEYVGLAIWSNGETIYQDQRVAFDWFRVTEP